MSRSASPDDPAVDAPDDPPEGNAYFRRPFCIQELRWTQEARVPVVVVVRAEDKHLLRRGRRDGGDCDHGRRGFALATAKKPPRASPPPPPAM